MRKTFGCLILVGKGGILLLLGLAWVWAILALFISGPGPQWAKISLACLFGTLLPIAFLFTRSFIKGLILCLILFAAHSTWWQSLQPTNNKDWAADVARISHGELNQNRLTMYNVRNLKDFSNSLSSLMWLQMKKISSGCVPTSEKNGSTSINSRCQRREPGLFWKIIWQK